MIAGAFRIALINGVAGVERSEPPVDSDLGAHFVRPQPPRTSFEMLGAFRIALIALAAALAAAPAPAFALDDEEAVDSAREGLDGQVDFPWYDEKNDQLQRVQVQPPPEPPKSSNWESQPSSSTTTGAAAQTGSVLSGLLNALAWIVIAGVLTLVVALLVRAFLDRESADAASSAEAPVGPSSQIDRVEQLPFRLRGGQSDLLGEARRHYEAGNYGEAVIYLFSHQLVELDRNQFIRLTRGKTNRQYLREIRRQLSLKEMLELTMIAFEDVFFGNHRLDRARFEACWNRLDEFHGLVQEEPA